MSDSQDQDRWQLLAAELGTPAPPPAKKPEEEPKAAEEETSGPISALPDPVPVEKASRPRPEKPRSQSSDWSALARDLGLEPEKAAGEPVEEAIEPAAAEPVSVEPVEDAERPTAADEAIELVELPVEETRAELDGGSAEFVAEPVELIEFDQEAGSEAVAPAEVEPEEVDLKEGSTERETGEGEQPAEKKSSRRRRGRRRRRPRSSEEQSPSQQAEKPAEAETDEPARDAADEPQAAELATGDDEKKEETPSSRPKRRRRRRPGRSKASAEAGSEQPEDRADSHGTDEDDRAAADDREDALQDEGDAEEKDSNRGKLSHRGVPTWKEAVDMLIDTNMESRAKRPEKASNSRGRGGRSRGGRRRSS